MNIEKEKQHTTHHQRLPRRVGSIDADSGSQCGGDERRTEGEGGGSVIPRRVGLARSSRAQCRKKEYTEVVRMRSRVRERCTDKRVISGYRGLKNSRIRKSEQ